jgi:hypothetical protein
MNQHLLVKMRQLGTPHRCVANLGKAHNTRFTHGASLRLAKAGPMSGASVVGLAKIGKAYRILLSPLVGTPHRFVPEGDGAVRGSEIEP